jgi:hypothetical protein
MRVLPVTLLAASLLAGCAVESGQDGPMDLTPGGKDDGAGYVAFMFDRAEGYIIQEAVVQCDEPQYCDVDLGFDVDGLSADKLAKAYFDAHPQSATMYEMAFMVSFYDGDSSNALRRPIFIDVWAKRDDSAKGYQVLSTHVISDDGLIDRGDGHIQLSRLAKDQTVRVSVWWVHNDLLDDDTLPGTPARATLYASAAWN